MDGLFFPNLNMRSDAVRSGFFAPPRQHPMKRLKKTGSTCRATPICPSHHTRKDHTVKPTADVSFMACLQRSGSPIQDACRIVMQNGLSLPGSQCKAVEQPQFLRMIVDWIIRAEQDTVDAMCMNNLQGLFR